jgi:hypothetical protein
VLAVVLLLFHVWLGPWAFAAAAVVVVSAQHVVLDRGLRRVLVAVRASVRSAGWSRMAVVLLGVAVVAAAAVISISSAYSADVGAVRSILQHAAVR